MEITKRYTLEDWRTQEIELHDIPEPVLSLSFEEVLKKTFLKVDTVDLNPIELLFACIFLHDGWRVMRTPLSESRQVYEYFAVAIERATGIREELYGSGVPDFFLWDSEGHYQFVEIKASEERLNDNQQEWAEKHDCNFVIAQIAHISDDLSEEEIIERNRIA